MKSPSTTEATPFDDGALYDLFFERLDYGLDFYLELARDGRPDRASLERSRRESVQLNGTNL